MKPGPVSVRVRKSKYSILVNDICVLNPSIKTQETNESKSQDEFYEDIPF